MVIKEAEGTSGDMSRVTSIMKAAGQQRPLLALRRSFFVHLLLLWALARNAAGSAEGAPHAVIVHGDSDICSEIHSIARDVDADTLLFVAAPRGCGSFAPAGVSVVTGPNAAAHAVIEAAKSIQNIPRAVITVLDSKQARSMSSNLWQLRGHSEPTGFQVRLRD